MKTLEKELFEHMERKHYESPGFETNTMEAFYQGDFVIYALYTTVNLSTNVVHYPFIRLDKTIGYGMPHEFEDHKKAERLYRSIKSVQEGV